MIRDMIKIDETKCDGCGLCVDACKEGALAIVNGKAKLIKEDHCDGLGNCLPVCPCDAITIEKQEAAAFIGEEAIAALQKKEETKTEETLACGCSKNTIRSLKKQKPGTAKTPCRCHKEKGCLSQWPVQIKLLPVQAGFYQNSSVLVAADCTAYAYKNFHEDFIKGRITLVGCPKLDSTDYSEKLGEIFRNNDITDITLTRMEVPCCGGMEKMVKNAIQTSGKQLPLTVTTISAEGDILNTEKF
ncbi:MAG: 4Fe-4S binding protein [Firmicutes bacterium]|nr:4Fe-4S binding protein [Bacillota bacterium]